MGTMNTNTAASLMNINTIFFCCMATVLPLGENLTTHAIDMVLDGHVYYTNSIISQPWPSMSAPLDTDQTKRSNADSTLKLCNEISEKCTIDDFELILL